MELKDYQTETLKQIKRYLELLVLWRKRAKENPDLEIDFPFKAWEKMEILKSYHSRKNGLGEYFPNFCLKIPTGGGKTFLAVKAIDLINTIYRKKRTGLILWVVPTNQIYQQTIKSLRNRDHPYRQHLDIASGGRTIILEKTGRFTPQDIKENLAVLMLMLPSAARQSKETLRMFRDNGGFQEFFPREDDIKKHKELLEKIPNLDTFEIGNSFWGRQIKTSLGNTLRLLNPTIILDEGHKAYSETAQDTLCGFNPSLILELSATPTEASNILVDVKGIELSREEMIKLDLHIINKASPDWKDTLLESIKKRNFLEKKASDYKANSGIYIRPICLIQAERTGREQRGGKFIHSEDVREYLVKITGIPNDQVAVTSAELKEIEGVDLLSKDCPIRYIITNRALQEGWDCSFAYILTVLTNPASKNALTQLVGRILRQPFARKTKVRELDESYVFAFQQKATNLFASIKKGFEGEGLGDLTGRIAVDEMLEEKESNSKERVCKIRQKFEKAASQTVLPVFVIKDKDGWRPVNYEMDIASRVLWNEANIKPIFSLALSNIEEANTEVMIELSDDEKELIRQRKTIKMKEDGLELDTVFLARHLLDIVPNPWIAYQFGETAISHLLKKHSNQLVVNNFVFIIEELRKQLAAEKDRLAKKVFKELLSGGILRFMVIGENFGFHFPKKIKAKATSRTLNKSDGQPLQRSLFDFIPEEEFNEMEKTVAWYLEDQNRLFFWYRNRSRKDYAIQGWQKQKIYPDFIFTKTNSKEKEEFNKVFVVETKGLHLKNEDTDYKKSVFDVCNKQAKRKNLNELEIAFKEKAINFEVVFEDEWKRKLNALFAG